MCVPRVLSSNWVCLFLVVTTLSPADWRWNILPLILHFSNFWKRIVRRTGDKIGTALYGWKHWILSKLLKMCSATPIWHVCTQKHLFLNLSFWVYFKLFGKVDIDIERWRPKFILKLSFYFPILRFIFLVSFSCIVFQVSWLIFWLSFQLFTWVNRYTRCCWGLNSLFYWQFLFMTILLYTWCNRFAHIAVFNCTNFEFSFSGTPASFGTRPIAIVFSPVNRLVFVCQLVAFRTRCCRSWCFVCTSLLLASAVLFHRLIRE